MHVCGTSECMCGRVCGMSERVWCECVRACVWCVVNICGRSVCEYVSVLGRGS